MALSGASRTKQIPSSQGWIHAKRETCVFLAEGHRVRSTRLVRTGTHALLPNGLQGGSGHGCKTCIHQITYRVDLLAGPELDP